MCVCVRACMVVVVGLRDLLALLNLQRPHKSCDRIPGSDGSEAAREEEQRGRCRCVNKVDCLIGRRVMNVVVIHSLKGHAVFLLTCGQP